MYYTLNDDGTIAESSKSPDHLVNPQHTEKNIVYGYDGKLYFDGDEPPIPATVVRETVRGELETALTAIDRRSTRAIRAILLDMQHEIAPSNEDLAVLAICEDEAMVLRDELAIVAAGAA